MVNARDTISSTSVYSVSDLNLAVRALLDEVFDTLWITGEISNFASPRSGHWYFTLKDAKAQIKCAMFRGANWKVGFQPENGMEISLFAKVSLYPERGDYQLIAEDMKVTGEGQLQKAYEVLKAKLEKEGLFDENHKKSFPDFPNKIAIITSATGAALKDILSVLARRYPIVEVDVIPAMVQGTGAAKTIVKAIKFANSQTGYDLIILARGGGSLEDLWSFNEESVAYAIFESTLPIICGIGHETDFTIADYVADLRAPTPSVAAETITPETSDLILLFVEYQKTITKLLLRQINDLSQKLDHLDKRLTSPIKALEAQKNTLALLSQRHLRAIQSHLYQNRNLLIQACLRLKPDSFYKVILSLKTNLSITTKRQAKAIQHTHHQTVNQVQELMRTLHVVSPLATLDRGYTFCGQDEKIVSSIQHVQTTHPLKTTFKDGVILSEITEIHNQS